jgi:putative transposase
VRVGRKRVARQMQVAGLQGVSRRKPPRTTLRKPDARPAPDLVDRDFTADRPNELWVADITYIRSGSGFLYLAVAMDAFSIRVVGWPMANHLRTELVLDALEIAIYQRKPLGVIHHSDQPALRSRGQPVHLAGVREPLSGDRRATFHGLGRGCL